MKDLVVRAIQDYRTTELLTAIAALEAEKTRLEKVVRIVPKFACGNYHQTDYGPAFCDRRRGHVGAHRCWGSKGAIEWRELHPEEASIWRAIAESIAEDMFGDSAASPSPTKPLSDTNHPAPEDTAALDDLIDALSVHAGNVVNDQCPTEQVGISERQLDRCRAAIHAHVAALVQAEREACLKIVEQDYSFTVNEQNTRNRIARVIRERSHV
jgi:hypothetical protein